MHLHHVLVWCRLPFNLCMVVLHSLLHMEMFNDDSRCVHSPPTPKYHDTRTNVRAKIYERSECSTIKKCQHQRKQDAAAEDERKTLE